MTRYCVPIGLLAFMFTAPAYGQETPTAPVPQTPPEAQPAPPSATPPPPVQEAAPPVSQRVYSYPAGCGYPDADGVIVPCVGQWVYTDADGWIWVPGGAVPTVLEGVPYVYLYTPIYGWTWYVSPWGWGPYFYGAWVLHPWLPLGWHGGWVAGPGVFGRLGGHGAFSGRMPAIRGGGAWHGTMRGGAGHGGGRR